jgi:hypothetical protein
MSDLSNDMLFDYINPIFGNKTCDFLGNIIETVSLLTVMSKKSSPSAFGGSTLNLWQSCNFPENTLSNPVPY